MERGAVPRRPAPRLAILLLVLLTLSAAQAEERSLGELRGALAQDDGNERRRAAVALGEHPSPEAVDLLLDAYRGESVDAYGVRAACAEALGRSGQRSAVPALEVILGDPDYWVRKQAALALGRLPGAAATAALEGAVRDRDPRVREAAAQALGGREGGGEHLLRAFRDSEPTVAAAALEGLVASQHPQAWQLAEQALAEGTWQVRYRAAALLARSGDRRGLEALATAIRHGHHVGAALREMAWAGDPAVEFLAALYQEPGQLQGARILATLETMTGEAATTFFADLAAARDAPAAERSRAAAVLFDRRDSLSPAQVDGLAQLLGSDVANLLAVTLQILLERGGPGHLPQVAPLVKHDNKVVRHFALSNLRRHGGAPYESSFLEALGDANGANVRLALEALGESGSATSLAAIRALAEERKYRRYAQAAADAIEARSR